MKYVIDTRTIFSFTRYEMLAYYCNTKNKYGAVTKCKTILSTASFCIRKTSCPGKRV